MRPRQNRDEAPLPPLSFDATDRPLRRDVARLGAQLGKVLRDCGTPGLFDAVERARLSARKRRKGDADEGRRLEQQLAELDPTLALDLVRAFSAYFGAVNMAEQVHRMRRRIDYRKQARPQPGSLLDVVSRLASRGVPRESVEAAASAVLVESVFTAHPTEVVRRSLLKKDQRLARVLVERFRTERSDPAGTERLDEAAALELATAWQTEEQLPGRPTVADEVEHVLFFLSDVLYRVVPFIHEELERAMRSVYGEAGAVERPVLRFSSWVGGDMDGNPNVDAGTIRATLERHQELALRRYREELRGLHEHLSQSTTRVRVAPALTERVRRYEELMPDAADAIPARYAAMPYRRLLWQMTARLEAKRSGAPHGYGTPTEFVDDLELLARSLEEHGGAQAGAALVRRALIRVRTFGFHLAALDVRQDAQVHRVAIGELLGIDGFDSWTAAERTARLKEALDTAPRRPELPTGKATLDSTLEVFRALRDVRARFGNGAVGPAIISMAQGTDDALAVLVLARAADCVDEEGRVPLDVVPLFETVEDLAAGPGVLRELATDRAYSEHLAARGRRQMVMLGYSDSNKDGGIAASRAGILEAQTRLVA
ncbi:MAG: phosphoenolpyruvate carboxylase, partial [Planctomycetota bacterium]